MKLLTQKIVSCLLAVVVLLSTVSFTVAKHYCGERVVDVTLYKDAKSCAMDILLAQKATSEFSVTKSPCCKDEQSLYQGQDELKQSSDYLSVEQAQFVVMFVTSYLEILYPKILANSVFGAYSPPPLIQDLQLLNATFLI